MKINRADLLARLESVAPGLSPRETIEQSSCFVFRGGQAITFNEEIACSRELDLGLEGAVTAEKVLKLLGKLTEETVDVTAADGELIVAGVRRRAGLRLDAEIALPVDSIEPPAEWRKLPDGFAEALRVCERCTGRDENRFYLTCVNVAPRWVEASDNQQVVRFRMRTGVETASLIRRESVRHVAEMGAVEFSETPTWLHFRNAEGLVLSCRRYVEDFPSEEITKYLKTGGTPVSLPKGLAEAADRAQDFSSDNAVTDAVTVELKAGRVRVTGAGASGWYKEEGKAGYQGEPLKFLISPAVLMKVTREHNEFLVGPSTLRVDAGAFQYLSSLEVPDAKTEPAEPEEAADEGPAEPRRRRKPEPAEA